MFLCFYGNVLVTSFTVILRPLDYGTATRGNPGFRVTLRITVYRQSVRLDDKPLESHDQCNFIFQFNIPYVTSSLRRGWVCRLQLLLAFARAVNLRSESRGTHDHILLSQIRVSPTWAIVLQWPCLQSRSVATTVCRGHNSGFLQTCHEMPNCDFSQTAPISSVVFFSSSRIQITIRRDIYQQECYKKGYYDEQDTYFGSTDQVD
jgi:hypothetical protein